MQDKEEKFAKIITIYQAKYGMTVSQFIKFSKEKVDAPA